MNNINIKGAKGLIISQFILFMQNNNAWPCHLFIGDDPQPLDADEVIRLKDKFVAMIED